MTGLGVCAPEGYLAAGVSAGIKRSGAPDLALIVSETPAGAAGCFTTNAAAAAPVTVSRSRLPSESIRGVVINSGCANALTGKQGLKDAREMAATAAGALGADEEEMLVCSTGLIGSFLPMDAVGEAVGRAAARLGPSDEDAARAIMTTDTRPKFASVSGRGWSIGAIAKGAGMISPGLATMIAVVTTDASVDAPHLDTYLKDAVSATFNRISVDGDMSTNDTVILLANGVSGVTPEPEGFSAALNDVCGSLAGQIVADGEGATRTVLVRVAGAASAADAELAARAVGSSLLVKTAVYGGDPNWGRVAAALGASGARLDPSRLTIQIGGVTLFDRGEPVPEGAGRARQEMEAGEVEITCELGLGDGIGRHLTCDLSEEYVRVNAEYEA